MNVYIVSLNREETQASVDSRRTISTSGLLYSMVKLKVIIFKTEAGDQPYSVTGRPKPWFFHLIRFQDTKSK